jgi:hypothetical protein
MKLTGHKNARIIYAGNQSQTRSDGVIVSPWQKIKDIL